MAHSLSGEALTDMGATQVNPSLNMENVVGCEDDILLAFAETAALSHWKQQERRRGTLSTRELLRQGDAIESALRASGAGRTAMQQTGIPHQTAVVAGPALDTHMHPPRPSGEHNAPSPTGAAAQLTHVDVVGPVASAAGAIPSSSATGTAAVSSSSNTTSSLPGSPGFSQTSTFVSHSGTPNPVLSISDPSSAYTTFPELQASGDASDEQLRELIRGVARVYRETAFLYAQIVVNEPSAGTFFQLGVNVGRPF